MSSPYDYPDDLELGLVPEEVPAMLLPCGCDSDEVDEWHDVDDCAEAQVDEMAYREDLRRGPCWSPPDYPLDTV